MTRDFLRMFLGNGSAAILAAAIIVLGVRGLLPGDWTEAALIVAFADVGSYVLGFGTVTFKIREAARTCDPQVRQAECLVFTIRRVVLATPLIVGGVAIAAMASRMVGLIVILTAARFVRYGAGVQLSAEKRFGWVSLLMVIEKGACLILLAPLWLLGELTVASYIGSQLVGLITCTAIALMVEAPRGWRKACAIALHSPFELWRGSAKFGMAAVSGPVQQLDVVIVTAILGTHDGGLFAAASRVVVGLSLVGGALSAVVLPHFSSGPPPLRKVGPRLAALGGAWLALIAIAAVSARHWVPMLLGQEYGQAAGPIVVYLAATVLLAASQPMMSILQAVGQERFVMWTAVARTVLGLGAIALGAWLGGLITAATGFLIACLITTLALAERIRRAF
jgi:O-antigen/teichoic acid export membrane protein